MIRDSTDIPAATGHGLSRCRDVGAWLLCGVLTSLIVLGGAEFGRAFVHQEGDRGFIGSLARRDGHHYREILEHGYTYEKGEPARIAFFPAFPMLGAAVNWTTRCGSEVALLLGSNLCLLLAFVLMGAYLRARADSPLAACGIPQCPERADLAQSYAILCLGLLPTTFFFRMAYSESRFLCASLLAMYVIVRGGPLYVAALIVGFATAVRPVGVALLLPLCWYAVSSSDNRWRAAVRLSWSLPLGCWGLLLFMAYQAWEFHEPFAFALTQENWRLRPKSSWSEKALSLLAWEPIWSIYTPGSREHAAAMRSGSEVLFNLPMANPVYFVGTVLLVALGARKRWLTTAETLLAIPLLAIPYVTRGYEFCMQSQGRFAAVVFPAYIVMGCLLSRLPGVVAVSLLAISGALMAAYAALFATGQALF